MGIFSGFHGVALPSTVSRSNWNLEMFVFVEGGKPEYPEKNPRSRDENQQQTQPTYYSESGNRTRATLVGGECSHHCAIPAPPCKEFGIEMKERWYQYEPKAVTEKDSVTTLWDMPIYTDRTIAAKRPDIVLKNKKDKTLPSHRHDYTPRLQHISQNQGKAQKIQRLRNRS